MRLANEKGRAMKVYCDDCGVVEVTIEGEYCDSCVEAIVEYLEKEDNERKSIERKADERSYLNFVEQY